jgi:hypothetical protein
MNPSRGFPHGGMWRCWPGDRAPVTERLKRIVLRAVSILILYLPEHRPGELDRDRVRATATGACLRSRLLSSAT